MQNTKPSTQDKIISAAVQILLKQGPGAISVDSILKATGLSRGGFFHHFPTMSSLYIRLINDLSKQIENELLAIAKKDPKPFGRMIRAQATLLLGSKKEYSEKLFNGLIHIANSDKAALKAYKIFCHDYVDFIVREEGMNEQQVLLLNFAIDGLLFNSSLGLFDMSDKKLKQFIQFCSTLTEIDLTQIKKTKQIRKTSKKAVK